MPEKSMEGSKTFKWLPPPVCDLKNKLVFLEGISPATFHECVLDKDHVLL